MGPMPIEDKKDKINSKLNTLYYKVINSKDRKEFLKQIEKEFGKQTKNYTGLLKNEEIKDYYNTIINELANRFENEKNKDIQKDINTIDRKLNMTFRSTLICKDEEAFRKTYNEFKKKIMLEDYKGENEVKKQELNKYIDNWINYKVTDFKNEKHIQKENYISDFVNTNYNDLKQIYNSEDDLKKGFEEKKKMILN